MLCVVCIDPCDPVTHAAAPAAAAAAEPTEDTGGVKKGRLTDGQGTSGQAVLSFVANTSEWPGA
jgi:hypothetical protein